MTRIQIGVGTHRPVYLWAGPGTIRMNALKFMGAPVDEAVHREAHTDLGARRMAEAGFNWAYLTYDWGFPPEVAAEDWSEFHQAVRTYHTEGIRCFGYIQASNCVYAGSYIDQDWYARDPRGRRVYYYTGRFMTCWLSPAWRAHLREMVRGVIDAGADGVFFDNPWHACQPLSFAGAWMGGAGCYCDRCRAQFRADTGNEIPARLDPEGSEGTRRYLRWRADLVTASLRELADHARSIKPDIVVSVNDFDAVMRPSYLVYGIDLQGLAGIQDVLMIEDYGLPHWEAASESLVNNALTLRTARALAGTTPLSTDPYDKGIGFDTVYPARRFVQGVSEAAACSAPMVVKGTEFVEDGKFTLLTAERFAGQRQALGDVHRWLEAHADLYAGRKNLASIGLLFPGEELWLRWHRLAPRYFGAGQTLLAAGLPWRVVARPEDLQGIRVLLTFGGSPPPWDIHAGVRVLNVHDLPGWELPPPSLLARSGWLRAPVSFVVEELFRSYFHSRLARRLLDALGLAHFYMQSPLYRLPPPDQRRTLLAAIGEPHGPRVKADPPALIEHWGKGGKQQIHLVNYANAPQTVIVEFGQPTAGRVLMPGQDDTRFDSERLALMLDTCAILLED